MQAVFHMYSLNFVTVDSALLCKIDGISRPPSISFFTFL